MYRNEKRNQNGIPEKKNQNTKGGSNEEIEEKMSDI